MLRRARLSLLVVAPLCCAASGCAGDAAGTDAAPDVIVDTSAPDVFVDTSAPDANVDSTTRDAAVDPLASLGDCLGSSAPLTLSHQMPYVSLPVGTQRGNFLLDFASTFSSIDLAAFTSPPSTSGCDASRLGVTCTVDGFAFFAPPSAVRLVTEDFRSITGAVRQAGILGTDFTSLRVTALSYATSHVFVGGAARCAESALRSAGLSSLSSMGFFSNDLGALAPMTSVDMGAPSGTHVPNVPTVSVRVAGARAIAQLDTGFDDALVPFSLNVNDAFYRAIMAADAGALVRDAAHDLSLSTCVVGLSEPVAAYTLASGRALEFIDDSGSPARRYPGATLFVKRTPPAAHTCGGIGTWTVPAAQVAASFFVDMGTIVFDPFTSRVWVPTR